MEFKFEHNTLPGSLELAYLGDTLYDLYVRTRLVGAGGRVGAMHRRAVSLVCACAVRGVSARGGCAQRRGGGGCPARAQCASVAAPARRRRRVSSRDGAGSADRVPLCHRPARPDGGAARPGAAARGDRRGRGRLTRGRALAPGAGRLSLDGRRSFRIVTGKLGLDANSRRRSFAISSQGFPVWRGQSREFFDESDGKPRNCGHFRLRRRANPARESSRRSAAWIEQTSIARRGSAGMERIRRQA